MSIFAGRLSKYVACGKSKKESHMMEQNEFLDKNVFKGLEKLKASQPKLYWIGCGKEDFLFQSAQDLRKFLDENKLNIWIPILSVDHPT